jgi:hypothetical protein
MMAIYSGSPTCFAVVCKLFPVTEISNVVLIAYVDLLEVASFKENRFFQPQNIFRGVRVCGHKSNLAKSSME